MMRKSDNKKNGKFFLIILLLCLACNSQKISAQQFTAEGEVVYKIYFGPQNGVSYELHKHFILKRNGAQWFIQTSNPSNKQTNEPADVYFYREAGCDGTNIFLLSKNKSSDGLNRIALRNAENPKQVNSEGEITAGIVPYFDPNLFSSVWLAYASKPYFDGATNGKVKHPEYVSDEVFNDETVSAEWQTSPEATNFIQDVAYRNDGTTVQVNPDGEDVVVRYPKPYDHGFTCARFDTDEFTNIDDFCVPAHFKFSIINLSSESTNGFKLAASVEGTLTGFNKQVDVHSFYPEFSESAIVTDNRFLNKGIKEFSYVIKQGGSWLQIGDPNLDKYLKYYNRNYAEVLGAKPRLTTSEKKAITIPIIILNVAIFVWVLLRLRRRGN
jgi:hypothetical protein